MMQDDPEMREHIARAHRNFLRDAIYFLYVNNRVAEAAKWFKYLGEKFPNMAIVENDPNSLPKNLTLDEYAVAVVQIDIGETSQERVTSAVQGLLLRAYADLASGDDDRFQNLKLLAYKVYENYRAKTTSFQGANRIPLPPIDTLNKEVVRMLLDPQDGVPYAARAVLRTRLGLPAETSAPATNAVPTAPVPAPQPTTETNR
jgi:hypothetical protein